MPPFEQTPPRIQSKTFSIFQKSSFTLMSFAPLFVVSALLSVQTSFFPPEGEARNLFSQILFYFSLVSFGLSVVCYFWLRCFINNVSGHEGEVEEASDKTESSLSFFVTYLLPVALCQSINLYSLIAYFIILLIVEYSVFCTNLYYENVILCLLGFRIIQAKVNTDSSSLVEAEETIEVNLLVNSRNIKKGSTIIFKQSNSTLQIGREKRKESKS